MRQWWGESFGEKSDERLGDSLDEKWELENPYGVTWGVSSDTSHTICAYPLVINRIRFGPQSTPQEGSYPHSVMEEQHMPDGHPSRY